MMSWSFRRLTNHIYLLFICIISEDFPWLDPSQSISLRASSLIARLNVSQKVSLLVVENPPIPELKLPGYHFRNNVLHGLSDNGVSTMFPQAIGMAATWDEKLFSEIGIVLMTEQRIKYVQNYNEDPSKQDMNYGLDLWGPNINLFVHPQWGRGQETYGEDPLLTSILATSLINSLQQRDEHGVYATLATPKHFAAYNVDRMPPRLSFDPTISNADLLQYYFWAWKPILKNSNPKSVMCSYNGINGNPMCMSPYLQTILRDELNFTGYLVTDSGAIDFMFDKTHFKRFPNATMASAAVIGAGVDLNSGNAFLNLKDAYDLNLVSEKQIDRALTRVLEARISFGQLDPINRSKWNSFDPELLNSDKHRKIALQVAEESIVLLKNHGEILPLDFSKISTISVIGPAANDTFRLVGNYYGCSYDTWGDILPECKIETYLQTIQRSFPDKSVLYEKGCDQESNDTSGFESAKNIASQSDVVIAFMGLRNCQGGQGEGGPRCESEGHDRLDLNMPGVQTQLLRELAKVGKTLILVVTGGGPVSFQWEAENLDVILFAWYGGALGSQAILNVLSGKANPSGRLPVTFPVGLSQVPDELNDTLSLPPGRTYRYLESTPLYRFGFGLSFGFIEYANIDLSSDKKEICATALNHGSNEVSEVTQLYASLLTDDRFSGGRSIPYTQLIDFTRTNLTPNTPTRICLNIDQDKLKLVDTNGDYHHISGKYRFFFGGRSPGTQAGKFVSEDSSPIPLMIDAKLF